jgi:hypothetical protein
MFWLWVPLCALVAVTSALVGVATPVVSGTGTCNHYYSTTHPTLTPTLTHEQAMIIVTTAQGGIVCVASCTAHCFCCRPLLLALPDHRLHVLDVTPVF